jgi:NADH-quinone oxidoreductase subunit L
VHSFDMKSDMGGLKKYMPKTFWTFVISSAALAGIFPLAGFWSKDEILAGTGAWPNTDGNGTYYAMLIMGLIGAAMTAAYMTRVVYLTFFGEYRGHGHPHESGSRITIPLIILAVLAVIAGFANLPAGFLGLPDDVTLRFEHYVEPVGAYFPPISHATASVTLAVVASAATLAGIAWAYAYYFGAVAKRSRLERKSLTEVPEGVTTKLGPMRALYAVLVNKYYLDWLYTDVIVGGTKGPIARAAYWFNQNVIDRTVDTVGTSAVKVGQGLYTYVDQKGIDGVVNGTGFLSEQGGEELRQIQTGKVQQYAALLFGGATVLAGIFIIILTA